LVSKLFKLGNLLCPASLVGGLEDEGDVVKAGVLGDITEALPANLAIAEG
jgi:hypothetical protein